MTENKRFEICGEGSTNLDVTTYIVEYGDGDDDCFELYESKEDSQKVCDKLNSILDENEQLKSEIEKLSYANEDLLEEKRIWKQMSDEYTKLSYENEQLKIKLEDIALDMENAKESNDDAQYELYKIKKENEQLKASLYAEKTNTAEVVNEYSKQFKRHSAQFSFMMDLADDLGVDVTTLEALDD